VIEHALVAVALLVGLGGGYLFARRRLHRGGAPERVHRILLPFTGTVISRRALDAALRLARAEGATLMPAYLAAVPKDLPLECAIPAEAARAMPILEAIEQRAAAQGVAVDSRIERGRSYRHALARLLADEDFDRVVVSATATGRSGISGDDLVWLLEKAPAEVLILRPAPGDDRVVAANGNGGTRGAVPFVPQRDKRNSPAEATERPGPGRRSGRPGPSAAPPLPR
jgi:nucleotide-binding universal stress UspA family protein